MEKLKTWFESKLFKLRTGHDLVIENDGKPVDPIVIRYKEFFFEIMIDAETGEPTGSFGWFKDSLMTHVPVREFYIATREEENIPQWIKDHPINQWPPENKPKKEVKHE